jgi:hypothetical protein
MNDDEMNELMVQPTVDALIAATVSRDATQIGAAIEMVVATDEVQLVPVAIGLARVAGPHAATVWARLGAEMNGEVEEYVAMVNLIYQHAMAEADRQEVDERWAECASPMRAAAVIELMSMAAMSRHYRWQSKK